MNSSMPNSSHVDASTRPIPMFDLKSPRIAIIGGGMAGLSCARTLHEAGLDVTVFDKARGAGGRMSTRRSDTGHFDHGAQYFTVRHAAFDARVLSWQEAGVIAPWQGRIVSLPRTLFGRTPTTIDRYVGVPGMSAVLRHMARDLDVRFTQRVTSLSYEQDHWWLETEEGPLDDIFTAVVLAVPAPQAVPLLASVPEWQAEVQTVEMTPTWAAMVSFEAPLDVAFDGAFIDHPLLGWAARDNSKPGRPDIESWVLHGTSDWSAEHLDEDPDGVAAKLLAAFTEVTGVELPSIEALRAHRWKYARTPRPLGKPCIFDVQRNLGICGDWCPGARVEGAYLSGLAVAEHFLDHASLQAPMQR